MIALLGDFRILLIVASLLARVGCGGSSDARPGESASAQFSGAAQVRWVSNGGSDSNDGTQLRPWATIQHAADRVNPGDTVVIRNGVYPETVLMKRGGAPGAQITFRPESKWGARVSPPATPEGYTIAIAVGVDYVTIKDLDITGQPNTAWGIKVNGNHDKIIGNQLHEIGNSASECPSGAAIFAGGDYANNDTEITDNNIFNISPPRSAGFRCNKMHGIYLTNQGGLVANNTIAQIWQGFGIHLYGKVANWIIRNNRVMDSGDNGHKTGGAYYISCGPEPFDCDNILVTDNTFTNNQNSCIFQDRGPGRLGRRNAYVNNVAQNCAPNQFN